MSGQPGSVIYLDHNVLSFVVLMKINEDHGKIN